MAPRLRCDGGISFLSLARIGYFYSIFVRRSLIGDCLERLKDAVGQVLESRRGCCLGFRATGLIFVCFSSRVLSVAIAVYISEFCISISYLSYDVLNDLLSFSYFCCDVYCLAFVIVWPMSTYIDALMYDVFYL